MRSRYAAGTLLALGLLSTLAWAPRGGAARPDAPLDAASGLDELLGRDGRQQLAATLKGRRYEGQSFTWEQYSAWGRELMLSGQVAKPPVGPAPSPPIAASYRCVHCHNLKREDEVLTRPDPEARARLIQEKPAADPARRDGETLFLAPAATLWGAVNRESYGNGARAAKYQRQPVHSGRRMDPSNLADAVEVCCTHSSGGRFPSPWELDSLLAYLWDLEVRLRDLGLDPKEQDEVLRAVSSGSGAALGKARGLLRKSYARAAEATAALLPLKDGFEGNEVRYSGKLHFTGDAKSGEFLYRSACAGCHGKGAVSAVEGAALLFGDKGERSDAEFYHWVAREAGKGEPHMPFFPAERLSRQQTADIRAYLRGLKK